MSSLHRTSATVHRAVDITAPMLDAADLLARLPAAPPPVSSIEQSNLSLDQAYILCETITRQHSRSFFFSSGLLPLPKRRSVRALYAICRTSDDIVDLPSIDPAADLAAWVALLRDPRPGRYSHMLLAWDDTRRTYAIPQTLVDELLAGIAMDLSIHRYNRFEELWIYCYRVASVVGLMAMQIIGYQDGASEYAVKLGVALQLTNILRDIGEDARRGRVYLPQEDLQRFGLSDEDILNGVRDQRFCALMQYEIARTRQLYNEAWPGIAMLSADSRLAIAAAAAIYRAILGRIEQNQYDVFSKRAVVPFWEKVLILARLRWGRL